MGELSGLSELSELGIEWQYLDHQGMLDSIWTTSSPSSDPKGEDPAWLLRHPAGFGTKLGLGRKPGPRIKMLYAGSILLHVGVLVLNLN